MADQPQGRAEQVKRARELRSNMSNAEYRMWFWLRRQNMGVRFRRQVPFGPYFLDFYASAVRLAVEVDGDQHDPEHDRCRDEYLAKQRVKVIRIPSLTMSDDYMRQEALDWIWREVQERMPQAKQEVDQRLPPNPPHE